MTRLGQVTQAISNTIFRDLDYADGILSLNNI